MSESGNPAPLQLEAWARGVDGADDAHVKDQIKIGDEVKLSAAQNRHEKRMDAKAKKEARQAERAKTRKENREARDAKWGPRFTKFKENAKKAWGWTVDKVKSIPEAPSKVADWVEDAYDYSADAVSGLAESALRKVDTVTTGLGDEVQGFANFMKTLKTTLKTGYAQARLDARLNTMNEVAAKYHDEKTVVVDKGDEAKMRAAALKAAELSGKIVDLEAQLADAREKRTKLNNFAQRLHDAAA